MDRYTEVKRLFKANIICPQYTASDIARKTGYSRERIRQLAKEAKVRLLLGKEKKEIVLTCRECGKTVLITEKQKRRYGYYAQGFCSMNCKKKSFCITFVCRNCGKKVVRNRKKYEWEMKHKVNNVGSFCSYKCRAKALWKIKKEKKQ